MKNGRKCIKCAGENIVRVDGRCGPYGSGNNIMLGATIFSGINVNTYICTDCGYTEEWIDTCDLDKIKNSKKAKPV